MMDAQQNGMEQQASSQGVFRTSRDLDRGATSSSLLKRFRERAASASHAGPLAVTKGGCVSRARLGPRTHTLCGRARLSRPLSRLAAAKEASGASRAFIHRNHESTSRTPEEVAGRTTWKRDCHTFIAVHRKINLADAFKRISEPWSPHVAGDVNECQIKLAKLKGDFVWHHHEKEDEVCQLVSIHRSLGRRLPAASLPAVLAHPRGRWIETACRSAF